jgi:hypothetical protein
MKRYETRTVEQHYQIGWVCDGAITVLALAAMPAAGVWALIERLVS